MNNGNLLNSLLGATGTGSTATTSTKSKQRAETGDKFQEAFSQVRPEVAARPAEVRVRKVPVETSASSAKALRSDHKENIKPVAARESVLERSHRTAEADPKPEVKTESDVQDAQSNAQVDKSVADSSYDKEMSIENRLAADAAAESGAIPVTLIGQTFEVTENDKLTAALEVEQVSADSAVLGLAVTPPLALDSVLANSAEEQADLPLVTGVSDEVVLAGNVSSGLFPTNNQTTDIADPILSASERGTALGLSEESLGHDVVEVTAASSGLDVSGGVIPSVSKVLGAQVPTSELGEGMSNDELVIGSTSGQEKSADLFLDASEASASGDESSSENPDFDLLNSKTALHKLAETSSLGKDKTPLVADSTKPVAPISTAIESIGRLADPQSPAARAFVVQTGVPVTVGTPQWSQAVGDKVLWLAAQNVSAAEIRLDPPELGPMQVKVSIHQDQASVTFTSPHPAVREALDQQLNRLRDMFSEQGLNLVNVDVSDKSFAQQKREQENSGRARGDSELDDDDLAPVALTQGISVRLVDHYA
jgi:flagellar hook-length control protein FliK